MKEAAICPVCGREQKPMVSIESLSFSAIAEEDFAALQAKKPGFLEKKIHAEMLKAGEEGRLRMAEAIANGIYREESTDDNDNVTIYKRQLIRTPNGSQVEGKFYEGLNFYVVEETEEDFDRSDTLLHVIRYENKKRKASWLFINS